MEESASRIVVESFIPIALDVVYNRGTNAEESAGGATGERYFERFGFFFPFIKDANAVTSI
jgi:hypothetical protein